MKRIVLSILAVSVMIVLSACGGGNAQPAPPNQNQVETIVAGTLAAVPTSAPVEAPATAAPAASAKLEDFPNKLFVGENERFSVFILNPTDPNNQEQVGPIIIYNKGTSTVYPIVGTFRVLNSMPIYNDDLGAYVVLSPGTYILRTAIIVSLNDKKQAVNDFCINGQGLFWNDYFLYNNCDTISNRPWGGGEAPSIEAVNLKTGAVTTIAKSDAMRHFQIKEVSGSTLQYEQVSVTSEADWVNSNSQVRAVMTFDLSTLGK